MRRHSSWLQAALAVVTLLATACRHDGGITEPEDRAGPYHPELSGTVVRLRVDLVHGRVTVVSPTADPSEAATGPASAPAVGGGASFAQASHSSAGMR
jgi:hypothetical protein